MPEYQLRFHCELLEDLHAGSGLGWLDVIDDLQARDRRGRPVVWFTTLTGLLRDAADELRRLGHPLATDARIKRLFGTEGADRSALVARSLHFTADARTTDDPPTFLTVTQTARGAHSRRPLDDTLRTIECAAAGLIAEDGELRFHGDANDRELIDLCLKRIRVGGRRNRGAGRVRFFGQKWCERTQLSNPPQGLEKTARMRLLLRGLEPLLIPATAHPGNILESETFLPGQTLRGAVLQAFMDHGVERGRVNGYARADQARFGNGYVLPEELLTAYGGASLKDWLVLPLPLSAQEVKRTQNAGDAAADVPWWALPGSGDARWRSDPEKEWDALRLPKGDGKRVKEEVYLACAPDGVLWRVRPVLTTIVRNRTPVRRAERDWDSRRPDAKGDELDQEKGELFSETVLAEDQLFVCDLWFADARTAGQFEEDLSPWLYGMRESRRWLRVGRGGRPVRIEQCLWLGPSVAPPYTDDGGHQTKQPQAARPADAGPHEFTLTLASDLIARGEDLGFQATLDAATLWRLADLPNEERPQSNSDAVRIDPVRETRVVHGFNRAAGTRRQAALALKRGLAFLVRGTDGKKIRKLFERLAQRHVAGEGLGERLEEGFGRFVLNHSFHDSDYDPGEQRKELRLSDISGAPAGQPDASRHHGREQVLQAVLDAAQRLESLLKDVESREKMKSPAKNQWQALRHLVEACGHPNEVEQILAGLEQHAEKLGGRAWATPVEGRPLARWLNEERRKHASLTAQKLFIAYLARWVVARLDARKERAVETEAERG